MSCAIVLGAALALASAGTVEAQATDGSLVAQYAAALGTANARLPVALRRDLAERVLLLSSYYKIDPYLLGAVVTVESAWHPRAVSPAGALGYGQLMPGTAATLGVDALEPYENLDGTARYLRRLINQFPGRAPLARMQLALAAYNAGPGAVARYHGIPPYRETRAYVSNVLRTRLAFVAMVEARPPDDVTRILLRRARASQRVGVASHRPGHRQRSVVALVKPARRTPQVATLAPILSTRETPPPVVRWERSRSFVARFLGLRHRVAAADARSTGTGTPATADVYRGPEP